MLSSYHDSFSYAVPKCESICSSHQALNVYSLGDEEQLHSDNATSYGD